MGLGVLLAPIAAQAVPLSGSIDFTGLFQGEDAGGNTVRLADAVAVDFCASVSGPCVTDAGAGGGTGAFLVNNVDTGSNLPVTAGDIGTIQDFVFAGFSGPITDFFTVGGLSFDLQDVAVTQYTIPAASPQAQPTDYLLINGVGVLRAAGFDDTPGTFTFSGQTDGLNLVGSFAFSGGSATIPVPVPVPAGLSLLGAGVLGVALLRRRRAA
ncbi:hypothetical protein [Sabulicella glaciei]|uniref:VPLPA-CTERM sorting domain-containing protein n=1 Tax=Sabulicella glaciei TaxID=2984948 RepID=A0ABT3NWA7_9PROT|nr:hypothetical protein [Roseococcus sp. MDT2-1-1]MCW8086456.1 VPLPA-CTERM sorting domain-containing protein [Roseococcus sp. MDT2-1-1]